MCGLAAARLNVTGGGYGYTGALSGDGMTALIILGVALTSLTKGHVDSVHPGRTFLHPHTQEIDWPWESYGSLIRENWV